MWDRPATRAPVVYILASKPRGTLYLGVTSNLVKRVWQHRERLTGGFTTRYAIHTLVWYEQHATMLSAIGREKAIKRWRRYQKLQLITATNPEWRDLWSSISTVSCRLPAGRRITPVAPSVDSRVRGNDESYQRQTTPLRSRE
jgi:putative endonuclease